MTVLPEDGPALRAQVIATARAMNAAGINVNKAGNVSARCVRGAREGLVITPTGVSYEALVPEDLVFIPLTAAAGEDLPAGTAGARAPSSEWRFHRDILRTRPEFNAIVHTHSPAATALACHGLGIPAFHYMVAVAGGADIRCATYATFGTQALSDAALAALAGRKACLLAHHGVIACERDLVRALALAVEVENLADVYLRARQLGEPPRLPEDEMARVLEKFATYGQPQGGRS
ncbi:MAG: class II aldolase/adducin family protein [Burkholderiaceae bacterium]|nr:class II aldolase/adducin family protein [Burkholderiaceae bacterium]